MIYTRKLLVLSLVSVAFILGTQTVSATYKPSWGECKSTGEQCGTDNGTQTKTTVSYKDPICPKHYHVQNAGNWNQVCHRDFNWMQPEHKAPLGCPEGYDQDGVKCSKETVEERSCQTGVIQYDSCEEEGQCPESCGYEGGEVSDGKGGYKVCEATLACENEDPEEPETPTYERKVENTFHKDTRCHAVKPEAPQWAIKTPAEGGVLATWSAIGGSEVEIMVNNANGEWEYNYGRSSNDGHEFLPNMGMNQLYKIRVINDCSKGDWLVDP